MFRMSLTSYMVAYGAGRRCESVPMFKLQSSLPKQLLPPLQQTLERYLASVKPITTTLEEFHCIERPVKKFGASGGIGERLQKRLLQKYHHSDNWLADYWVDARYLQSRAPLYLGTSPTTFAPKRNIASLKEFLLRSATLLIRVTELKVAIDNEQLPVDYFGGQPLCMDQYRWLFSTSRLPGRGSDKMYKAAKEDSLHVIVLHRGHMFQLQLLYPSNEAGALKMAPLSWVKSQLLEILQSSSQPCTDPVGLLTSADRETWFSERTRLMADPGNQRNLKSMQDTMFVLCIDQPPSSQSMADSPLQSTTSYLSESSAMVHSGQAGNTDSRLWDAAIQLFTSTSGYCGINQNHTKLDGSTIKPILYTMISAWHGDLSTLMKENGNTSIPSVDCSSSELVSAERLKWNLPPETRAVMSHLREINTRRAEDYDMKDFLFDQFGDDFISTTSIPKSAFVIHAVMLARYRLEGSLPPIYSTLFLRMFKLGRTDRVRVHSQPALDFCKAMCDEQCSPKEQFHALKLSVDHYQWLLAEANRGQTVDRHLFGLQQAARELNLDFPQEIEHDQAWRGITRGSICFNGTATEKILTFATCPMNPKGYETCYIIHSDRIFFNHSCWASSGNNCTVLGQAVNQALVDLRHCTVSSRL